ncbi:unnamed protein product, partial [Allacma fusca]
MAQFSNGHDETHWKAAKGVLRYLRGTTDHGITYRKAGSLTLKAYTDSDYAGDKVTQYIALNVGAKEVKWLRSFMSELSVSQPHPTDIFVDNQSSIKLAKNPEMHSRTKHIDVRYHHTRDLIEQGKISIKYIATTEQLADGLTKPLMKTKLVENRNDLGLHDRGIIRANLSRSSPWTIFALLAMFVLSACASSHQNSHQVIWRKSKTPITIGHYQVNLKVNFVNPCDILKKTVVHSDLLPSAQAKCNELYQELFISELEKMCQRKEWTEITLRKKRVVDLIIGLIIIAVIASAGIGIAGTTIAVINSN